MELVLDAESEAIMELVVDEILFFAIFPDPALAIRLARRMSATCRTCGFTARPISANRLHISLLSLGGYSPRSAEQACRTAGAIKLPAFEVRFDRVLSFRQPEKCPFVLTGGEGLADLREFARQFNTVFGKNISSFTPHLTLIWDYKRIEPRDTPPVGWMVREFALVRSFQGKGLYEIMGRWPLENILLPTEPLTEKEPL